MVYQRIRDLREDKDMTQVELSKILLCSSAFTAIMNGAMWIFLQKF